MAFSDPQSVKSGATATWSGGTATSLPKISSTDNKSVYANADGTEKLTISDIYSPNRTRRMARLDFQKIAANPLDSSKNSVFTGSTYIILDQPVAGFSTAELKAEVERLTWWIYQTGVIDKLIGGEN